ncbi:hypothetical protein EDC94DRAFT_599932, partial [Helicostylum pulchrum]
MYISFSFFFIYVSFLIIKQYTHHNLIFFFIPVTHETINFFLFIILQKKIFLARVLKINWHVLCL